MSTAGEHVSPQWATWRATVDLGEYESRFGHPDAHGEADFLDSLRPRSVLDAGCGTGGSRSSCTAAAST